MPTHPAFDAHQRSLSAHRAGRPHEALALAEAAHRMLDQFPGGHPQDGEVRSWYGFVLGTTGGRIPQGLELCRLAARRCFWEPRVHERLARLELAAGWRRRALEALERGVALCPWDAELLALRRSLGVRQPPVVSFLPRSHPLNRWLGRLSRRAEIPPETRC